MLSVKAREAVDTIIKVGIKPSLPCFVGERSIHGLTRCLRDLFCICYYYSLFRQLPCWKIAL